MECAVKQRDARSRNIMTHTAKRLRIMLVDACPQRSALLEQALHDAGQEVVARMEAGDGLMERVGQIDPDVIIIDMDAPDRDTLEHMRTISRDSPKPIVMFTNNDDGDTIRTAIRAGVSAYVVDGLSATRVMPILEVAIARFQEFDALRRELEETKSALAERKIVERAKGILMKQSGMDEENAYRALRKMAMDRNLRLADLSKVLIAATDLLGEGAGQKRGPARIP